MGSWKGEFPNGWIGGPHRGNGLYGTHESFGQAHFPKPHLEKLFYRDFPISQTNPWASRAPCGDPYWPLVELFPIWPPAALSAFVMSWLRGV